jgi:hypothetical protein
MQSSAMLRLLALIRTDISEGYIASIIMVTKIDELGTTLALTSKRILFLRSVLPLLVTAFFLARRFLLP